MSAYENNKVINLPLRLLKDPRLSEHELLVLIKILSYNLEHISIVQLDNDFRIKKNDIAPLVDKNYLRVITSGEYILIDVNPLFESKSPNMFVEQSQQNSMHSIVEQYQNPTIQPPVEQYQPQNIQPIVEQPKHFDPMEHDFIQRVSLIWNRALNSMEIDKINDWLSMGVTKSEIEQALQKAIFNNANNFAYVETILLNNQTKRNSTQNVTRNVELY